MAALEWIGMEGKNRENNSCIFPYTHKKKSYVGKGIKC